MKKIILLVIVLMCFVSCAFADVIATILDVSQDANTGAIVVKTNYVVDGEQVVSRYPVLNTKYYWVTRYNVDNFAGMTDLEVKNYILKDLKSFAENIIKQKYLSKANFSYSQSKANLLIGTSGTISTAEILVDTNADNIVDTKWTVKSDGTRTESAYVAP